MKFLTAVLFLMPILYGYKCAPVENQMQEWKKQLQESKNYAQEQRENARKLREESKQRLNRILQESRDRVRERKENAQKQRENAKKMQEESQQIRNQMLQIQSRQIQDSVTGNGANPTSISVRSSLIDKTDSNGNRVYDYIQTTRTNNIERQTRNHWNHVSKKIETTHYVRDWTKPNSEFVLENN